MFQRITKDMLKKYFKRLRNTQAPGGETTRELINIPLEHVGSTSSIKTSILSNEIDEL